MLTYAIVWVLRAATGVSVDEYVVYDIVTKFIEIAALIGVVWGQLARKDLSWGFWRK